MMRELSSQPGFTEAVLKQIDKGGKNAAILTPDLFDLFREIVLGKDWSGLDRFPGWPISRVTRTVKIGSSLLKSGNSRFDLAKFLDLGPYPLDQTLLEDLDKPSNRPAFSAEGEGLINQLSPEVTRGDGADPKLAPLHSESARLAEVLNRLSMNGGASVAPFSATIGGHTAATPQELISALVATGHRVTVADARYFANFGHFHYNGKDVEMPFWLDSRILVPADHWWQNERHLLIPVAHAEYEWIISGPRINADVAFYFGIDGKAEFRTNDQLNQPWVMGRHAHEYRDAQALEVTRLTGKLVRAYANLHGAHPSLPFSGYYTMGVCQDGVSAIEQHMTGKTTLFPNTAKEHIFDDQPDEEVRALMDAVPRDTSGAPPAAERIFGSLPTEDMNAVTIPGLRQDLLLAHDAWTRGKLRNAHPWRRAFLSISGLLLATFLVTWIARDRQSRRDLA